MNHYFKKNIISLTVSLMIAGCSNLESQVSAMDKKNRADINKFQEKAEETIPVVTSSSTAWIMGAPVQLAEPVLPILNKNVAWHPTTPVSLADVASWITQNTGLVVDIAELQTTSSTSIPNATTNASASTTGIPGQAISGNSRRATQQNMWSMYVNYEGPLSGLLNESANKSLAWWKVVDGKVIFFKTETKTFYFPAIARKFTNTSTITSSSGTGSSSGSSGTQPTGGSTAGGLNISSEYVVGTWEDIESTAKAVSGGAVIAANKTAGSITVTGSPAQVRNVEKWAKELIDQQSQQVAITMRIYTVKVTNEDNYNWNPTVIFKNVAGSYGYNFSGPQAPAVISGITPSKFSINVLTSNVPGKTSQYSGSELAFQALSSMGTIIESIEKTITTLNGEPAPFQIANTKGYLASSATSTTANVGATTTLTPGSLTTGFTGLFIPRIINGKIIVGMDMQNSSNNGFTEISSGTTKIQNPDFDSTRNQQSVSLTPGDALLLTGLKRDNGALKKSGVGSPNNYALGGGLGNNVAKEMIAIVISAKIL